MEVGGWNLVVQDHAVDSILEEPARSIFPQESDGKVSQLLAADVIQGTIALVGPSWLAYHHCSALSAKPSGHMPSQGGW
jgi:hypothetical protein